MINQLRSLAREHAMLLRLFLLAALPVLPLLALLRGDDAGVRIVSAPAAAGTGEPEASATVAPTAAPASGKRVAVSAAEVLRGPADRPYVSLVINAGSGYPPAAEELDVLASRGVKTTFFLMGHFAEKQPDLVRRIHDEGHEIASHGYKIFDLTLVSDAEMVADLEYADAIISGITGQTTRPLWSPSAGYRNARVNATAARLGYRPIIWTADSGDWRETATADGVLRQALAGAVNGAIIVLHMDSPRSRSATAVILGQLIDTLRERGLEPVTITELIGE